MRHSTRICASGLAALMLACGAGLAHEPARDARAVVEPGTGIDVWLDVLYATGVDGEELFVDVYQPADSERRPAEVWLHGGAMRFGNKGAATGAACEVAAINGRVCFDADYRLTLITPDNPDGNQWPKQLFDVKALIRFIRASADRFMVDGEWIAVNGHSAGGQLAMLLATTNGEQDWVTCDESPDSPYAFVAPGTSCADEPFSPDADVQAAGAVAAAVDMQANCELMAQLHGWYDQGWDHAWELDGLPDLMPTPYMYWFPAGDCVQNAQRVDDFGPEGQGPGDIDPDALAEWLEASPLWRVQNGSSLIPTALYAPEPWLDGDGDGDGQPGITVDGEIEPCLPCENADPMVGLAGTDVPMEWGEIEAYSVSPPPYTYDDSPFTDPCWGDTIRSDLQGLNYVTWVNANGGEAVLIGYEGCPHTLMTTECMDGDAKGDEILIHWNDFLLQHGF